LMTEAGYGTRVPKDSHCVHSVSMLLACSMPACRRPADLQQYMVLAADVDHALYCV